MTLRPLALAVLPTLTIGLSAPAEASVWLADLEVTELAAESITETVRTSCRTYDIVETEGGYRRGACAEYNTAERDTLENRYTVTVTNLKDDTARSPEARFFVPFGAEVVSVDHPDCEASRTVADQTAVVECFFADLNPRDSLTFEVVTTKPGLHPYNLAWGRRDTPATVMVSSLTPDWDLTNNTATATVY